MLGSLLNETVDMTMQQHMTLEALGLNHLAQQSKKHQESKEWAAHPPAESPHQAYDQEKYILCQGPMANLQQMQRHRPQQMIAHKVRVVNQLPIKKTQMTNRQTALLFSINLQVKKLWGINKFLNQRLFTQGSRI